MLLDARAELRKTIREARELTRGGDRYVDFGIELHVVRRDPDGAEFIEGRPRLRILRTHRFGGLLDTRTLEFVGPSREPLVWYCSEQQEGLLLHDGDRAPRQLVYGSMGAGKTQVLAMWLILRSIAMTGIICACGATAPTEERVNLIADAVKEKLRGDLYQHWRKAKEIRLANGVTIQMRSTTERSKETGNPVQGQTWFCCGSDEIQDSISADHHIEMRGRGAPKGIYRRLNTATAKDDPPWRDYVAERKHGKAAALWQIEHLLGPENPFTFPTYWEHLKATLSPRNYQRLVLAQDVPPENRVYVTWDRDVNLRPVPAVGARNVTQRILGKYGRNLHMLIGHDPGEIYDVSILLQAYELPGLAHHVWFVVDEFTTERTTTEQHATQLRDYLRSEWQMQWPDEDEPKVLVRCDPHGESESRPDRSVYLQFKKLGIPIRAAAYTAKGKGSGRIDREARIEMVCRLLQSASGESRLYVACDEHKKPLAPRLVEAFERQERDEAGRAEAQRKGKNDQSHWTAALGYGLWAEEKLRLQSISSTGVVV